MEQEYSKGERESSESYLFPKRKIEISEEEYTMINSVGYNFN
jgi:hypothetical protein